MHSTLSQPYTSLLRACWTLVRTPRLLATHGLCLIPGTATSAHGSCKPCVVRPRRPAAHFFPHTRPPDTHALEVGVARLEYWGSLVNTYCTSDLCRPRGRARPPSAYCDRCTFTHRVLTATGTLSPSTAVAPASTFLVLDPASATCIYRPILELQVLPAIVCLEGHNIASIHSKDFGVGWILSTTSFRHCLGDFQTLALDPGEFVCTQPTATGPAQRRASRLLLSLTFRDASTNVRPPVPPWSRPWR